MALLSSLLMQNLETLTTSLSSHPRVELGTWSEKLYKRKVMDIPIILTIHVDSHCTISGSNFQNNFHLYLSKFGFLCSVCMLSEHLHNGPKFSDMFWHLYIAEFHLKNSYSLKKRFLFHQTNYFRTKREFVEQIYYTTYWNKNIVC